MRSLKNALAEWRPRRGPARDLRARRRCHRRTASGLGEIAGAKALLPRAFMSAARSMRWRGFKSINDWRLCILSASDEFRRIHGAVPKSPRWLASPGRSFPTTRSSAAPATFSSSSSASTSGSAVMYWRWHLFLTQQPRHPAVRDKARSTFIQDLVRDAILIKVDSVPDASQE